MNTQISNSSDAGSPDPTAPSLPDAVDRVAASVVGLATRRWSSAGVIWRDGVVATSASALSHLKSVSLVLPDGEQVQGEVRGVDGATDLAAVVFSGASMPAPSRGTAPQPRVGDFVFAVGRNAAGLVHASFGHVGAVGGEWRTWRGGRVERLIRLDGGLPPGLAGAPVADVNGNVCGIASAALSRHGGVVLPSTTVDRVVDQLLAHGHVPQGFLGVAVQAVGAELDGAEVQGLLVSSLVADGPAARGGLKVGDVIVRIGTEPTTDLDALRRALTVGNQARVLVARGGRSHELTLEVQQRPGRRCG